jgi:hypothetical protein
VPQIFPVQPQQVEAIKDRFPSPVQKFIELATALRIQAANLTVQNRIRSFQFCQCSLEGIETFIGIFAAGNQVAATGRNVSQGAEAIVFQFEEKIRVVEWRGNPGQAHWFDYREHDLILGDAQKWCNLVSQSRMVVGQFPVMATQSADATKTACLAFSLRSPRLVFFVQLSYRYTSAHQKHEGKMPIK